MNLAQAWNFTLKKTGIPYVADLLRKFDSRSNLDLVDSLAAENASILLPSFLGGGIKSILGDKTRAAEKIYDGGNYTMFMRISQHTLNTGTHRLMTLGGGVTAASRGIEMVITSDRIRIYTADGTTGLSPYLTSGSLNTITWGNGVFYILFHVDFANKLLIGKMYNSALTEVGTMSQSIATFVFNSNNNVTNFALSANLTTYAIDGFKKFSALKTLEQCLADDYTTDLQIHIPHFASCLDISGNLNHFTRVGVDFTYLKYAKCGDYALNNGFVFRRHLEATVAITSVPVISSKNQLGVEQTMPLPFLAHRITRDAVESVVHNMVDSKFRFANAFFDRSNATIWNANARIGYYDASNVKDFHISEMNQKWLYDSLNDGYRGRVYVHMTPNSVIANQGGTAYLREATEIIGIYLYTNDHKGAENKSILTYTGDILIAVKDEFGAITYDADGYVKLGTLKTTKPMFIMRIDDGYDNAYTGWYPALAAENVRASMNIHSAIVGTTEGQYTFMTWAQIKELRDAGWEICSSGMYDNDWGTGGVAESTVDTEMLTSKQQIEAQGIVCDHLVPNRYGIANLATRYYAKKHGFKTCHAGNIYGTGGHGANPQALDVFNMCAMSFDLSSTANYFIDTATPAVAIANITAQLQLAKDNNALAIGYVHIPSPNLIANTITVINLAKSMGFEIVTISEALTFTKYQ